MARVVLARADMASIPDMKRPATIFDNAVDAIGARRDG
jgi:hypothetical protein